jgi:two-component system CheB/CheR fusion protein
VPDNVPTQTRVTRTKSVPKPSEPCAPLRHGAGFRVVAIGASAGGLEACKKLLDVLPTPTGMAFILVQHLDPTHKSLLVNLLAAHTALAVVQAATGAGRPH